MPDKRKTIELVLRECFWGDYILDPTEVERRLEEGDEAFEVFLVSRILAQSSFPSARLRVLFPQERLRRILDRVVVSGRLARRRNLVRAVLLGEPLEGEEHGSESRLWCALRAPGACLDGMP
jgi:hypothetical protein